MKYDFTSIPDRSHCGSSKWNQAKGASVENVPLSVADMEFYTAPPIREALKDLAENAILGYTQPTGEYYNAVCSWMERRHNFPVKEEWIVTTPGVVDALGTLVEAATKPGDAVLILTPVYYPFDMAVVAKGRKIVYSQLVEHQGRYEIDFADLEKKAAHPGTKAILFCNPHNPIGRVWTRKELWQVAKICCSHGVFIIDDEIHNDLIMPGFQHTVMATLSGKVRDNIAVCTAPSKTFNLAGVQCSNIIIPNEKMRMKVVACRMMNMQSTLNIFAYTACIAAYNKCEDWLEELISVIAGNAKYLEEFMAEHFPEIRVFPLEGTYLQWVDMRGLGMTHVELRKMLEGACLYLDNGEMFGEAGRGFQRFNLACARETLQKALLRFKAAVEKTRETWETEGKPVHQTLKVGDTLKGFVYDSVKGRGQVLEETITKPTLIVFSRYYECDICRTIMGILTAAWPALKMMGYDVKFVMQSGLKTLSAAASKYPFELVADPQALLYDRYNIFEADSYVKMLAGDKLYQTFVAKHVKRLLDTSLANAIATAMDTDDVTGADGANSKEISPRQLQLSAFVAVNENLKISYVHYCKTIADFPGAGELVKGLKKSRDL